MSTSGGEGGGEGGEGGSGGEMTEEERKRRVLLAHKMAEATVSQASTEVWSYEARVSPVYVSSKSDDPWRVEPWRIQICGESKEGRLRTESFDLATARAYHKLLGEVLAKFDAGEIKQPW